MKQFEVFVRQTVVVILDETRFTPEWMQDFRGSFYEFYTLPDPAKHTAQIISRGLTGGFSDAFVEGYGRLDEMGITVDIEDTEVWSARQI